MKHRNNSLSIELADNNSPSMELAGLVSQLSFTDERADYRESTHWKVHAHPWPGEEGGVDVLITIIPRSSAEEVIVQDLRIFVHSGKITWFPNRLVNRKRGEVQAWFEHLPLGKRFIADVPKVEVALVVEGVLASKKYAAPSLRELAAESLEEDATAERRYYLSDSRIIAIIEEGREGLAVLTIQTRASGLAGASIRFKVGEYAGEVTLKPSNRLKDVWEGIHYLEQPFKEVEACDSDFEVELP